MVARIYQPSKSAMQSGRGKTHDWVLQYEPSGPRNIEPLMGWTSSADTQAQIKLKFASKDEAIAYAKNNGIPYTVEEPVERKVAKKSYADNFKFGRIGRWTH